MDRKNQSPTTFNDVIYRHANKRGNQTAICFLPHGEGDGVSLTYRELDARAKSLAVVLQERGARGERVMLATHDNVGFTVGFLACLYSGAVVVPVPMLDIKRLGPALSRLQSIIADAKARFFLTQPLSAAVQESIVRAAPDLAHITWVSTDDTSGDASAWQKPEITRDTPAFLQYTSGSTGQPKGVIVSQGNLLANSMQIEQAWGNHPNSVFVSWLPQFHDFGLIFMAMQSLYLGTKIVSMPPAAFVKSPLSWLRTMSKYRGTVTAAPNFAYDLCVSKSTPAERQGLDLSSMETFVNGAEPVRAAAMRHFLETFAPYGLHRDSLRPGYGLAEATVFVSGTRRGEFQTLTVDEREIGRGRVDTNITGSKHTAELVSCGRAGDTIRVAIVSPDTLKACATNEVGEIWVKGDNVSTGYFERPVESKETFGWELDGDGPFLRTGDLGFVYADNIYVTGRRKDMLIVRGNNYYPQDFEASVEQASPAIRAGFTAAFAVEAENEERLVIVAETSLEQDPGANPAPYAALSVTLCKAVADKHELAPYAVVLVRRSTIPKTSSGKIQRQQCKSLFLSNTLDVLFQETFLKKAAKPIMSEQSPKYRAIQQYVVELLKLQPSDLQSSKNLAAFGFDSIDGASLAEKIMKDWGVEVALEVIPAMTIQELVDTIAA